MKMKGMDAGRGRDDNPRVVLEEKHFRRVDKIEGESSDIGVAGERQR